MQCTTLPALMSGSLLFATASLLPLTGQAGVANGSFELPSTSFVNPQIDDWQKTPQPAWFDPATTGGITWDQLSGVFANPAEGQAGRKVNIDGNQAAYLFALPQAGLIQVLPDTFQTGLSYELTVGVAGGGGNMPVGTSLLLGFFYLDGGTPVPLGSQTVAHDTTLFPTTTSFVDLTATQPVAAGDAWAGQPIGVQIVATSGTGVGFWDLDNVRVNAVPEPQTYALLGLGAAALAVGLRRNRRS